MSVSGPQGSKGVHKTTYERKVGAMGTPYIKPKVRIPMSEQKWAPQKIDPKKYSSLSAIKKMYPKDEIKMYKCEDGSVLYEVYPEGFISDGGKVSITVTNDPKKGNNIKICERVEYPYAVFSEYQDGKLVHVEKSVWGNEDPDICALG